MGARRVDYRSLRYVVAPGFPDALAAAKRRGRTHGIVGVLLESREGNASEGRGRLVYHCC